MVGALGTFRLVRSYDAPPAAAYVAAVAVPMGGMTQYLDLPSWAAAEMIWALLPWVWWALRRTMSRGANPLPALVLGYLLVSVGYVFGTIMLIIVLVACLVDSRLARDWAALRRVLVSGLLLGLVALTVYLPGVLTASVTARDEGFRGFFGGKFTTDPLALLASVLPTAAVSSASAHLLPYVYVAWFLPAALWLDWGRARREWRPLGGLLLFTVASLLLVDGPAQIGPLRWPLRLQPFLVVALVVLLVVAWHRFGLRPTPRRLALSLAWVALAGLLALLRAPSMWAAHLSAVVLVAAGISLALVAGRARPARLGRALRRAPDADPADRPARVLPDAALAPAQRPDRPRCLPGGAAGRGRRRVPGRRDGSARAAGSAGGSGAPHRLGLVPG